MGKCILFVFLAFFFSTYSWSQSLEKDTTKIPQADIFYRPNSGEVIQKIQKDSLSYVPISFGDLLDNESSVFVNSYGVSGLQSISIRGTGSSHTSVYWNGIAIQSPTLGMTDLSTIMSASLGEVEIHFGASSLVDGSGGLGGSIQLTDRLKYEDLLQASLQTGFGSFGKSYRNLKLNWSNKHWATEITWTDVDAPNVFAFVNPTQADYPTDTLKNAAVKMFSPKIGLGYQWNERLKIESFIWFNNSLHELPKSITANDFGDDYQLDQSWRGVMNLTWIKNKFKHEFSLGNTRDELNYFADFESRVKTKSLLGNYRQTLYLIHQLKIKSALEFQRSSAVSDGFEHGVSQDKIALMVNPQWKWKDKLTADFIFRMETYDQDLAPLMPSLLLSYKLNKNFSCRAAAAHIYRHPTFNDLYWINQGNPDLKPENGISFELGVDFLTESKNLAINLTTFRSEIKNWIIWLPDSAGWTSQNLFFVKSQGLDLAMKIHQKITSKINMNFKANYSFVLSRNYNSALINDPNLGKQLIYVPKNKLGTTVDLTIKQKWRLTYRYRFTDKRFILRDHSKWMPYFMISDLSLMYHFQEMRWVDYLSINVNNLLNKNYEVMPYRPMMPRNVMVNLRFNCEKKKH